MVKGETLRISVYSKIKGKQVIKTTNTNKYESKDKALQFLKKWKDDFKANEQKLLNNNNNNNNNSVIDNEIDDKIDDNNEQIYENNNNKYNISVDEIYDNINYTKFNFVRPDINENACSTVIYGSSQCGKTTQVIKLINEYFDDKNLITIFISPNIHKPIYKDLPKNVITMDRWDDQLIKDIHKIQQKTCNKYRFLIATDDIIETKNNKMVLQLILILRNSLINSIICMQDTKLISRAGRGSVNNFIFRKYNGLEGGEDSVKLFLGSFTPFNKLRINDKIELYKKLTKDYKFIYLNALEDDLTFHKGH